MQFAKKSLGQNFLIDKNIIKKIINIIDIENKNIIEIGSGKGALTNEIIKKNPKSLSIIEKDFNLSKELNLKYKNNKIVKIYNIDVLKLNIEKLCRKNSIIFGNLPYNISSQILVKILKFKKWPPKFTDLILMFQKELGEKILGKFPSANYGRLSILTSYRLKILKKFLVSPNCFLPKPKVTSLVIHFKPQLSAIILKDISNLEKITNIIFSNKRKMINKNIKKILSKKDLLLINNLKLNIRPAEIEPEIFYNIAKLYEKR
ncbi:16S rRNA (adenine(1518)-N(6)/adenine(1519)-N(6))-dimethyltransferase RsmA [Candidatus Pelagibacter bacterium]|jgi:16S rRNA (adenine1518-N6/adenine1519-N6)-dimethyltransferase|nr:16S rRNA (adenine(1518)-N(6)/adenine(1519)-N(6))-dimethyltransferase RsmA [Candidatus Pelagibacter bacterium]